MKKELRKAVFLDRDGVVIPDKGYMVDVGDILLLPDIVEAMKNIPRQYLLIIISNQSGIGRGYFTASDVDIFNDYLISSFKKKGVFIDEIYYCPHKPDDNCECRKPKTGLFEKADAKYGINFKESWMIGDKNSDVQAGINIGAKTILIERSNERIQLSSPSAKPDYIVGDLLKAVEIIKDES